VASTGNQPSSVVAGSGGDVVVATLVTSLLKRIFVPLAFLALAVLGSALATGAKQRTYVVATALIPGTLAVLSAAVLWARRAVLYRDRLEVRSLLGTSRVLFDELEAFTFDARAFRLYLFIPFGRAARLVLTGKSAKAVFQSGVAEFDQYLPLVIDHAVAATVRRMRLVLDRGERAHFGKRLSVDPASVYVKGRLFGEKRVSVEELLVKVDDGEFHLSTPHEHLGSFAIRNTPNLLALPQLLEELSVTKGRPRPAALQAALKWGG
jgi:hypothetical protein